jgi:hypothetical protein
MSPPQVDTNLESPKDIVPEGVPFTGSGYRIAPYSFFEDSVGEAPTEILLKMKNEKVTT